MDLTSPKVISLLGPSVSRFSVQMLEKNALRWNGDAQPVISLGLVFRWRSTPAGEFFVRLGIIMTENQRLSALFVNHAADVLAETNSGLSGNEIVRALSAYAIDYNVDIPHPIYPFDAPNKRTALSQNLMAFPEEARYRIIRDLCNHPATLQRNAEAGKKLKLTLMARYGHLDSEDLGTKVNEELIEQTRHWLGAFPEILELFNQALSKYTADIFTRNLLDDLRLSLEKLVQSILGNLKSLENQVPIVGSFVKGRGGSPELSNMFVKLIDYYCKYQNTYIKHDDAVIEEEVEFIIEITAAFMKHFVRLAAREEV